MARCIPAVAVFDGCRAAVVRGNTDDGLRRVAEKAGMQIAMTMAASNAARKGLFMRGWIRQHSAREKEHPNRRQFGGMVPQSVA
jgi:hypothetical protein